MLFVLTLLFVLLVKTESDAKTEWRDCDNRRHMYLLFQNFFWKARSDMVWSWLLADVANRTLIDPSLTWKNTWKSKTG
ncbi:hypothetical protein OSTOST_07936, partial [Ostertagia ostertagi]